MKQVAKSAFVLEKLRSAEMNPDEMAVFEAIALNTRPIRKKHPLFNGAVHDRAFLDEMAGVVNAESLPLQLMHDSSVLPVGRVIYGEVKDTLDGSELRVIFAVDKSNEDIVKLIENGTVDQVSVSFLAKQQLCSECGFDFFGEEATFENLWSGTCPEGHTMGKNGAHLRAKGLDSWFEMSLVGKGGATGAKIVSKDRQMFKDHRLAANGLDLTFLSENIKTSDIEDLNMDISKLVTDLAEAKVTNLRITEKFDAISAELETVKAKLAQFEGKEEVISKEDFDKAVTALQDVAKKVLVATGDVEAKVEDKSITDLVETINVKAQALVVALADANKAKDSISLGDNAKETANRISYAY